MAHVGSPLRARLSRDRTARGGRARLQDQGRRHLVDHLGAAAARDVGLQQRALGGGRRQPLVPEQDGQRRELARGCARRRAWPGRAGLSRAVETDGQSDHEPADAMLLRQLQEAPRIGRELGCAQRGEPRGDGARHIGEGEAQPSWCRRRAPSGGRPRARPRRTLPPRGCRLGSRLPAGCAAHWPDHDPCCGGDAAPYTPPLRVRGPNDDRLTKEGARRHNPGMKITWYGHSCFRLETGNSVILIDPFLKGNPRSEASGIAWDEATAGVTHRGAHARAFRSRRRRTSRSAGSAAHRVCQLRKLAMYVKSRGAEKLEPMNTGGTVATADFELTLVNALHSPRWTSTSAIPTASSSAPRRARRSITWATPICSAAWRSSPSSTSPISASSDRRPLSPWEPGRPRSPARSSSPSR